MTDRTLRAQLEAVTSGRYEVLSELGSGGMATVFLARDLALPRNVAIKVLSPALASDADTVMRFRREAKVAAALDHPGIVAVYDVGEEGSLAYFVMQHIDGESLASILAKRGPQSVRSVAAVVSTVGRALFHAHGRGIIHRDVKPANLLREVSGRIVVADFGIAKREELGGLTASGAVFGTPAYMSPEQYNGVPATAASDQYSLGVVAFELLTGRLPFVGDSLAAVMAGHLADPPPDPREFREDIPGGVADAVLRMLAKEPQLRFPDVRAAAVALEGRQVGGHSGSSEVPRRRPEPTLSEVETLRLQRRATPLADPNAPTVRIARSRAWVGTVVVLTVATLLAVLIWR